MKAWKSPFEYMENVTQNGAGWRGNKPDPSRMLRKRAPSRRVEQSLLGELCLQLFEGELQYSRALDLQQVDDELIFAPGFIHLQPSSTEHGQPVSGNHLGVACRAFEQDALDLASLVFERKVVVAAVR